LGKVTNLAAADIVYRNAGRLPGFNPTSAVAAEKALFYKEIGVKVFTTN